MALTKSSILHYWSARYGPIARIGGKPVHTRNSIASWIDTQGIIQSAPINTPRFQTATIESEDRPVMRLEQARTNRFTNSEDLSNGVWIKSQASITTNATLAPDGTLTADKIVEDGTTNSHIIYQAITYTTATGQSFLIHAKAGERTWLYIRSDCAAGREAWVNLATGAVGTKDANLTISTRLLGGGWVEIKVTQQSGITSTAGELVLGPTTADATASYAGNGTAGIYVWGCCHFRDALSASSYTKTTSAAATCAIDQFYWDWPALPSAMMVYSRHIERGTVSISSARLWQLGNAAGNAPTFLVYFNGTRYAVFHNNNISSVANDNISPPVYGDVCELVALLKSDGKVRIIQSKNGLGVSDSGETAALSIAAAWSDTKLWLNSDGTTDPGLNDFAEFKAVAYADVAASTAQGIMDELRAFEVNAAGEVISA